MEHFCCRIVVSLHNRFYVLPNNLGFDETQRGKLDAIILKSCVFSRVKGRVCPQASGCACVPDIHSESQRGVDPRAGQRQ